MIRLVLIAVVLVPHLLAQKVHELCSACHNQHFEDLQTHAHFTKGLSCDACHGASREHREASGGKMPDRVAGPAQQAALCGACHTGQGKSYAAGKHGQLVAARSEKRAAACTTCHGTHAPRKPVAMVQQCNRCHDSLPPACAREPAAAAKVRCAGCHDPHSLARK